VTVAVGFHGATVPSQDSSGARGNAKPTSVARTGACTSMLGTTRPAGQRPRPQPDPIITATEPCWPNVLKTALSARKRSCRADVRTSERRSDSSIGPPLSDNPTTPTRRIRLRSAWTYRNGPSVCTAIRWDR
jgi:hypothetical protein